MRYLIAVLAAALTGCAAVTGTPAPVDGPIEWPRTPRKAPVVEKQLNPDGFLAEPCGMLPADVGTPLGLGPEGNRITNASLGLGSGCLYTNFQTRKRISFVVDLDVDGLDGHAKAAIGGAKSQEPATFGGQPGFRNLTQDACVAVVGLSDEPARVLSFEVGLMDSKDPAASCEDAKKGAEAVVARMPAGAPAKPDLVTRQAMAPAKKAPGEVKLTKVTGDVCAMLPDAALNDHGLAGRAKKKEPTRYGEMCRVDADSRTGKDLIGMSLARQQEAFQGTYDEFWRAPDMWDLAEPTTVADVPAIQLRSDRGDSCQVVVGVGDGTKLTVLVDPHQLNAPGWPNACVPAMKIMEMVLGNLR